MHVKSEVFKYKKGTIQLEESGIVCYRAYGNDMYTETDLLAMLDIMEMAASGEPFLLMMQIQGYEVLLTKEARKLFNKNEKAISLVVAEAIVLSSFNTKTLFNLIRRFNEPKFPFRAFSNEEAATEWLLSFK